MNLNSIISIDNLKKLDLHGFDRDYAKMSINQFINEMRIMKIENFVIVHGVGTGVLKTTTHETLSKNKYVKDFKTYYYNDGCTIVEIKKD